MISRPAVELDGYWGLVLTHEPIPAEHADRVPAIRAWMFVLAETSRGSSTSPSQAAGHVWCGCSRPARGPHLHSAVTLQGCQMKQGPQLHNADGVATCSGKPRY